MTTQTRYPRVFRSVTLVCWCLAFGTAVAHIKNEASQFPDIEFSESRFDIVVLVGAGIIPETPVFEPDKLLSRKELATWAALAANLGPGGETPDTDALAGAALEQGLVDTLEGEASFGDLNVLFFDGQLSLDQQERVPTKAEAASLIAAQLMSDAGRALLERRGLGIGDTGLVTMVESHRDHHGGSGYIISIGDTAMPVDSHGRVANGPTDLLQWQDRMIRRSFVRGEGESAMWAYLEAEPIEVPVPEETTVVEEVETIEPPPEQRNLLYWLIAGVVILGLLLFFRRKRAG